MHRLLLALSLALLACSPASGQSVTGSSIGGFHSPNILLVIVDDIGKSQLDIYGAASTETTELDSLESAGVHFTQTITSAVCGASRASMFSGQYGYRTGVGGPFGTGFDEPTIFHGLHHYGAGVAGKGGLGGAESSTQDWHRFGAEMYGGFLGPEVTDYTDWEEVSFTATGGVLDAPATVTASTTYLGDYTTDEAQAQIAAFEAASNDPWIVVASYATPVHAPLHQPPGKSCTPVANCTVDMIDYGDDELTELLTSVDLADTLVIWVSDNGPTPGGTCKGSINDCGINVPMVASGWGVEATGAITALISSADIYATLIEVGQGQQAPSQNIDGCSFMHLLDPTNLNGPSDGWDSSCTHSIVYATGGSDYVVQDTAGYKLVRNYSTTDALYLLPDETTDLCSGDCDANLSGADRTAWTALAAWYTAEGFDL